MNKIVVIIGAVTIAIALGTFLYSFFHSPGSAKTLTEMTVGEFKGILWQVAFAEVIGICGIIITAIGLFTKL